MSKRDLIIDAEEDPRIRNIAYSKYNRSFNTIFTLLYVSFLLVMVTAIFYGLFMIDYKNKDKSVVNISSSDKKISIINSNKIEEKINEKSFVNIEKINIERINSIELKSNNKNSKINYDVKYNIIKNTFRENVYTNYNSDLLVRFSYSYDKEKWTYIKSVISTSTSNIGVLMGNYYDISGKVTNLSVATNQELELKNENKKIIYWRSETVFQNINDIDGEIEANFKIEYKDND
jgi:hypothetical protein